MLSIFLSLAASSTVGDITQPYDVDKNGKIGLWEYSGATVPTDDAIILVPPLQHRKGCLWTDAQIPELDTWFINFTLQIPKLEGGQFAIWFNKKYGEQGNLAGGPQQFSGIALVAYAVRDKGGKPVLLFKLYQNNGRQTIDPNDIMNSQVYVDFSRRDPFRISLKFEKKTIKVYTTLSDPRQPIISEQIKEDISENYIGITAQTDYAVMLLHLLDIKFDIQLKQTSSHSATMKKTPHNAKYNPSVERNLRNTNYNLTSTELLLAQKETAKVPEKDVNSLLTVIEEITKANYDVASFSELNSFIRNNILNYTQKWQRRTVKLVERVQNTRDIASAALNYTQQMMEMFRDTMNASLAKTNSKIGDMTNLLNEIGNRGIDENNDLIDLANDVNKKSIVTYLIYAAIGEIVGITILLISATTCCKRRVYGRLLSL